jgi:hypothetical protein
MNNYNKCYVHDHFESNSRARPWAAISPYLLEGCDTRVDDEDDTDIEAKSCGCQESITFTELA